MGIAYGPGPLLRGRRAGGRDEAIPANGLTREFRCSDRDRRGPPGMGCGAPAAPSRGGNPAGNRSRWGQQIDSAHSRGRGHRSADPLSSIRRVSSKCCCKVPRPKRGPAAWVRGSAACGPKKFCVRCCPESPGASHRSFMGESAELMVKTWGITRADQDQLGAGKSSKGGGRLRFGVLQKAWCEDYLGLSQDNNIRS